MCDECGKKFGGDEEEHQRLIEKVREECEKRGCEGFVQLGEEEEGGWFFYKVGDDASVEKMEGEMISWLNNLNVMPGSLWVESAAHTVKAGCQVLRAMFRLNLMDEGNEYKNGAMVMYKEKLFEPVFDCVIRNVNAARHEVEGLFGLEGLKRVN